MPLGVADITGSPVVVDLTWSNLTVAGPPRSGRSTVLDTAAAVLADTHEVWAVGPSSSPVDLRQVHDGAIGKPDELAPVLERLANLLVLGTAAGRGCCSSTISIASTTPRSTRSGTSSPTTTTSA